MKVKIEAILVGHRTDKGFVQEGYEGLVRAASTLPVDINIIDHIENDADLLVERVLGAAKSGAQGIVVHGSRADAAIHAVAPDYPDTNFLSPGGSDEGPNIWNYAVRHYEASFLAGVLAARTTKAGIVGHLSGVPIAPGKRARAAYVHGIEHADPDIQVLTAFCGNQDDIELAKNWFLGEVKGGADVIFTMLNYGRPGTFGICEEFGVKQIGNIRDWTKVMPEIFIGSAIAGHGMSVEWWIRDLITGKLKSGVNPHYGLEKPAAVRLDMLPSIPSEVRDEIEACAAKICSGEIKPRDTYSGPEFVLRKHAFLSPT